MEKENKHYSTIESIVKKHKKYPGLESILEDIIDDVYLHSEVILNTVTNESVVNAYLEKVVSTSIITVPKKLGIKTSIASSKVITPTVNKEPPKEEPKVDKTLVDRLINNAEPGITAHQSQEPEVREYSSVEEEQPKSILKTEVIDNVELNEETVLLNEEDADEADVLPVTDEVILPIQETLTDNTIIEEDNEPEIPLTYQEEENDLAEETQESNLEDYNDSTITEENSIISSEEDINQTEESSSYVEVSSNDNTIDLDLSISEDEAENTVDLSFEDINATITEKDSETLDEAEPIDIPEPAAEQANDIIDLGSFESDDTPAGNFLFEDTLQENQEHTTKEAEIPEEDNVIDLGEFITDTEEYDISIEEPNVEAPVLDEVNTETTEENNNIVEDNITNEDTNINADFELENKQDDVIEDLSFEVSADASEPIQAEDTNEEEILASDEETSFAIEEDEINVDTELAEDTELEPTLDNELTINNEESFLESDSSIDLTEDISAEDEISLNIEEDEDDDILQESDSSEIDFLQDATETDDILSFDESSGEEIFEISNTENSTEEEKQENSTIEAAFVPVNYSQFNFEPDSEEFDDNIDTELIVKDIAELANKNPKVDIIQIYNLKYKENQTIPKIASDLQISEDQVIEALNEIIAVI